MARFSKLKMFSLNHQLAGKVCLPANNGGVSILVSVGVVTVASGDS